MSVRIKTKKQAKQFNLLLAGHARTGKTDFIHTLYETLEVHKLVPNDESQGTQVLFPLDCTQVTPSTCRIECKDPFDARILLQLIDSPGLDVPAGIHRASQASLDSLRLMAKQYCGGILRYIETQFAITLEQESKIKRNPKSPDYQVHALLYLLNPDVILGSKGLTPMDKLVLEQLCKCVNVIPCLAKSDLVTVRDLKQVQSFIRNDIADLNLNIYDFGEDEQDEALRELLPFCLINSEEAFHEVGGARSMGITINGEMVLGREYNWGTINVENPDHCDFTALSNAILGTHMDDLIEKTREVFYEHWRTENLTQHSKFRPESLRQQASRLSVASREE